MAKKRTAITDLNHDNWDEEEEPEEVGIFKSAPKEELQKREIRTARRRKVAGQDSANTQANTGVFGAFAGFNKAAPSSFDFLSKLTNGAGGYDANGSPSQKDSSVVHLGSSPIASSTAIFSNPPSSEGAKSSLFGVSSNTAMKSVATSQEASTATDKISSKSSTVFSIPPSKCATSIFGTLNTLPTTGLPLSIPPMSSEFKSTEVQKSDAQTSKNQSVFDNVAGVLTPFKSVKGALISGSKGLDSETPAKKTRSDEKGTNRATSQYYSKLKGLNESVSDWIKKHVNENPLCILTPIFKDYEIYLKELEDEKKANESRINAAGDSEKSASIKPLFSSSSTAITPTAPSSKPSAFSLNTSTATTALFSFGTTSVSTTSANMLANAPLSFGISPASTINTRSTTLTPEPSCFGTSSGNATATSTQAPFSFGVVSPSDTSSNSSAKPPFSFGIGNTFSFNANVQRPPENKEKNENADEEDAPPIEEFTPIKEDNSVFDKKCKIFFKKDGNFVDKGVGTLYIKKIDSGSKHQLIVRANTSLGTLLLNFILNESLPMQRMGKNNVMIVCIPMPDAKPPPVAVLIRVKNSEEADGLFETLNKYKK